MTVAENVAAARRVIAEGFSEGNLAVCDELFSPDMVEHQRGLRPGIEGVKDTIRTLRSWFSDFELTIVDLAASDDTVWIRNRATGVNTGEVFGQPATGRSIDVTVVDIMRFADGRIVEHWGVPDQLGMLIQLGLFRRPDAPAPA
jgi:predicted ester cyclase